MMKSNRFERKIKSSNLDTLSPWTSVLLSFPESCPEGRALYD